VEYDGKVTGTGTKSMEMDRKSRNMGSVVENTMDPLGTSCVGNE
jgi:hypothetical protein